MGLSMSFLIHNILIIKDHHKHQYSSESIHKQIVDLDVNKQNHPLRTML